MTVFDSENCVQLVHVADQRQTDEDDENAAASGTTTSYSDSVRQDSSLLFQPSSTGGRSASSGRGKKWKKSCPQRTWTVQFVCLASCFAKNTPTATEKMMLHQKG